MNRWFLMLPDILVFFSIWGFGFFTGVFIIVVSGLIFCWGGGEVTIRYSKDEIIDDSLHF